MMKDFRCLTLLCSAALLGLQSAELAAQLPPPPEADPTAAFEASLNYQTGAVDLAGGLARLDLSPAFRYLNPDDAARLLVEGWGNPTGDGTLGMIIPADISPMSAEGWGIIVTYSDEGHVDDADAATIDYTDLLKQMQEETAADSEARVAEGQTSIQLVGWAEPPRYDQAERKLYWAKELAFGEEPMHTLNYNIRALGREGVLVLNAVAGMGQIDTVRAGMSQVLQQVGFTPGNTYADYDASTDKAAAYGFAALVAGGLAAKTGLLAKLLALLLVGKKFIGIAVLGGGAWLWSWLRKPARQPDSPSV
jgi:uncharacterized membrane-anchored protein